MKMPMQMHRTWCRRKTGSTLALMVGITATFIIALLAFALGFVRFIGSHQQQVTAIEAASLAAAKDLSALVVEDQNLGFISLSDAPPVGHGTKAGDNYFLPVQSINTILATARLNMIIADQLKDQTMIQYATRDYNQAMQARLRLVQEMQRCIQSGQTGTDMDGNTVNVYADALNAYNSNPINISSGASLVPNSMKLTLGWEDGLVTNMHVPNPSQFAQMNSANQQNGFYKAFVDVPYDGRDFVFAAVNDQSALVDFRTFRASTDIGQLPYVIPSVVKCEADQQFHNNQNGHIDTKIVHVIACSEPACAIDTRPASGALFVSCPNGAVPGVANLYSLLTTAQIIRSPADTTQQPSGGDFPTATLTPYALPFLKTPNPPYGQTLRVGLHDWIRRSGPGLNVQSLFDCMKSGLSTSGSPHADVFKVTNGTVSLIEIPIAGGGFPVSDKQWYSVTGVGYQPGPGQDYDVYCTDYVYQPGRINGGIHAGEPLLASAVLNLPGGGGKPPNTIQLQPAPGEQFPTGPGAGAVRPSYTSLSIAVEIRFRER